MLLFINNINMIIIIITVQMFGVSIQICYEWSLLCSRSYVVVIWSKIQ